MKPSEILITLGAVGAAVAAFWFASSGPIEPPDKESVTFLRVFCTIAAALVGAGLLVLRHYGLENRRLILVVALLAGVTGVFSFFRYESLHNQRIADVYGVEDQVWRVVVVDRLTPAGMSAAVSTGVCDEAEVLDRAAGRVTWECARRAASQLYGAYEDLFAATALTESVNRLSVWYWITALATMLALLLVVDAVLHSPGLARALQRKVAPP